MMGHQSIAEDFRLDRSIPFCASLPVAEGADPPGGNFLLVQKVTKNTLRGSTPKDPNFLEQGRGGGYFTRRIGRTSTYEPWHSR